MYPSSDTSSRIMHHVTKLESFQNWFPEHDDEFTTKMAPTVTRSQPNRASLECGLNAAVKCSGEEIHMAD